VKAEELIALRNKWVGGAFPTTGRPQAKAALVIDQLIQECFSLRRKAEEEIAESDATLAKWLAVLKRVTKANDRFESELAARDARLAVMADCLKWLDDHHAASHGAWHNDAEKYSERRNNQVLDTVQQILQFAPTVLYRGKMYLIHRGTPQHPSTGLQPKDKIQGHIGKDEAVVEVIVLARPEKEGSDGQIVGE